MKVIAEVLFFLVAVPLFSFKTVLQLKALVRFLDDYAKKRY